MTRSNRTWLASCVALASAASALAAPVEFNTRNDTSLRASPISLRTFDEATATVIVGDATGIQMMRAEPGGLRTLGEQPTDAPIGAMAVTKLAGGTFIAYNVRGEQSVRIIAATARGTMGTGPSVLIPGRPRAIVGLPNRGFIVLHSAGVDLLEAAAAGAFRRARLSSIASAVDAAVIDLDGDAHFDLVLADEPLGEIVVLRGVDDGEMQQVAVMRTQRAPKRVVAADFDGDGKVEVVVLGERGLSLHARAADGSLEGESVIFEASHLADLAAGDIDGNGISDLVFTNRSRGVVSTLLGRRKGGFQPGPTFLTGTGPGPLIVGPLSGGDRQEIIVANAIGNSLTYVRHDRRGLMGVAAVASAVGRVSDAAAADFDGDGHLDLALTGEDTGQLEIHLGMGNGHFRATPPNRIGIKPRSIVTGDWDGDGHADLAIANFGSDQIAILYGQGTGAFAVPVLVGVGTGPTSILHGDFGGPAGNDLAVANRLSEDITIVYGDSHGRFSPGQVFAVGLRPTFLFAGDVDGDGREDLVTGNRQYETITILPREENGFGDPYNRVLADAPHPSAARDLDGDGRPELVVTDSAGDKVLILKGNAGNFTTLRTLHVGRSPTSIEFGDFDADGQQDIAVVHEATGVIAILLRLGR